MKRILLLVIAFVLSTGVMASDSDSEALNMLVRLSFPSDIKTVEQAVTWLLEPTEYTILTSYPGSAEILGQPAPQFNDPNVIIPLRDAIAHIVDGECEVLVDHQHKLITIVRGK